MALNSEGILQQFFLLLGVHRCVTTSRCCRSITTGVFQDQLFIVAGQDTTHVVLAAVPGALVHRLFLAPHHILEIGVRREDLDQIVLREWIQLLDTHDGDVFAAFGTAFSSRS